MSNGSGKSGSKSTFHFVAGLGSGVLSAGLLQPFDLLKTRVQQSGHHSLRLVLADLVSSASKPQPSTSSSSSSSSAPPRSSPLAVVRSLWRGTVPSALRTGFGSAVYFTSLNAIRQNAARMPGFSAAVTPTTTTTAAGQQQQQQHRHSSSLPKLSNTGNMLAGATARAFAGFVLMPLTVIKVRFESSLYGYTSLAGAARDIYATGGGARGFFAGFGATAVRDAPYAGLYVLFYEQSKKRLSRLYGGGGAGGAGAAGGGGDKAMGLSRAASINFASGIFAGVVCSVVSNPFDAVKTRIQLQPARYRNTVHAARRMLAEEGLRSMWDGLALRMSRKAMSSALAWTVYEELIRRAERNLGRHAASSKGSIL